MTLVMTQIDPSILVQRIQRSVPATPDRKTGAPDYKVHTGRGWLHVRAITTISDEKLEAIWQVILDVMREKAAEAGCRVFDMEHNFVTLTEDGKAIAAIQQPYIEKFTRLRNIWVEGLVEDNGPGTIDRPPQSYLKIVNKGDRK